MVDIDVLTFKDTCALIESEGKLGVSYNEGELIIGLVIFYCSCSAPLFLQPEMFLTL